MKHNPIYYTDQHFAFADSVRKFVQRELIPHINEWEEAETFPKELYQKAAEIGLLGIGFDERYGGIPETDAFHVLYLPLNLLKLVQAVCALLYCHIQLAHRRLIILLQTKLKKRYLRRF